MMPENIELYICIYLAIVSLWAIGLALYDKRAARHGSWRIKERTLLLVSALGGSVAMYSVMLSIRHKTKHAKFMVGLPVIIILQTVIVLLIFQKLSNG